MKRIVGIGLGVGIIASMGMTVVNASETDSVSVPVKENTVENSTFRVDSKMGSFTVVGSNTPVKGLMIERSVSDLITGRSGTVYGLDEKGNKIAEAGSTSRLNLYVNISSSVVDLRSDLSKSGWSVNYSGNVVVKDSNGVDKDIDASVKLGTSMPITNDNSRDGAEFVKYTNGDGVGTVLTKEPGGKDIVAHDGGTTHGNFYIKGDGKSREIIAAPANENNETNSRTNGRGVTSVVSKATDSTVTIDDKSGLGFEDGDTVSFDSTWTLVAKP